MLARLTCLAVTACLAVAPAASAVDLEPGAVLFQDYCAHCHGADGRGGGPMVEAQTRSLPDLRTLTRRNGGAFPFRRIVETVDGRTDVAAHGPRFMPAWGDIFRFKEDQGDTLAHARILNLVWYLSGIQEK